MTGGLATTEDLWLGGRLKLKQPRDGYRVAVDAALLAAATPLRPGGRALELGAGVGAAALALAVRVQDAQVDGLELQPELAALAGENAAANGLADRVDVRQGDVLTDAPQDATYDAVLFNPPYLLPGKNDPTPHPMKRIATVEGAARLGDWCAAAAAALKPGGHMVVIHRADRSLDVLNALRASGIGALVLFPLWPRAGQPARRIIVTGRKARDGLLTVAAGLVLHDADGGYTAAAEAALSGGSLDVRPAA